jgi:hypothetical protein
MLGPHNYSTSTFRMSQPAEVTNEEVQTADVLPFFLFEYSMEIGASPVKLHSDSSLTPLDCIE